MTQGTGARGLLPPWKPMCDRGPLCSQNLSLPVDPPNTPHLDPGAQRCPTTTCRFPQVYHMPPLRVQGKCGAQRQTRDFCCL